MGLLFTDEQLSETSLEYVSYDDTRTALLTGKVKIQTTVDSLLEKDNGNKVWTDFYRDDVLTHYHSEKELLDRITKTLYPGESLIDAGAQKDEVHFPATPPNVWIHLVPKKVDSNTGLPTSAFADPIDQDVNDGVSDAVDIIKNGYNDGSVNTDLTNGYTIGDTDLDLDDVTDVVIGQRLLVIAGAVGLFCRVTGINQDAGFCTPTATPDTEAQCAIELGVWTAPISGTIDIEVLVEATSNLGSGANVSSSASGFTNAERESSVGVTPEEDARLTIFKNIVDAASQNYEDFLLSDIKPILDINEDQKRESEITTAKTNITDTVAVIDDWQSFPEDKAGPTESRFGDIKLGDLGTGIDARETHINGTRIGQVTTALGSLAQDANDGSFSGSGVYFDYYDWINKRINSATGSLSGYYSSLIALEVIDQKIADLDSNRVEQETTFRIEPFDTNFITANQILVADTTGFSITDTIKVFADGQPTLTVIITDILAGTIEIDQNLTPDYSVDNSARVLKQF